MWPVLLQPRSYTQYHVDRLVAYKKGGRGFNTGIHDVINRLLAADYCSPKVGMVVALVFHNHPNPLKYLYTSLLWREVKVRIASRNNHEQLRKRRRNSEKDTEPSNLSKVQLMFERASDENGLAGGPITKADTPTLTIGGHTVKLKACCVLRAA
eukprot:SAG31_NODE_4319_length_3362_cov_2.182041_6_plen_154_part_00